MPNIRGGKGYKKFKRPDEDNEAVFLNKEKGQFTGCIIRLLGSLNTSVFCEDNKTRICKIAEGIKKRTKFFVGDIVLVSMRDCLLSKADLDAGKHSDRGDVIAKYHRDQYSQLRAEGVNPHIFRHVDTLTSMSSKFESGKVNEAEAIAAASTNDDLFESGEEEEEEEYESQPKLAWKMARAAGVKEEVLGKEGLSNVTVKKDKEKEEEIGLDDL